MPTSSLWRRATLVIAASAAPVLALAAPGATAARARAAAGPNPSSTANTLRGVSAVSGSDAWAVGNYTNNTTGAIDTLILHWDGTAWAQVPAPSPSSTENVLLGVSAVSGSDAWAAGYYINNTSGVRNTLVLHWDGTAWAQVPAPSPGSGDCQLYGLSAVSGSDAWAAGDSTNPTTGDGVALILHWNGTVWTQVASPGVSSADNELRGVSAVSGSDAWAVGYYQNNATGAPANPLILHWNGTAWMGMQARTQARPRTTCSPSARTRVATPGRPGGGTGKPISKARCWRTGTAPRGRGWPAPTQA